MIALVLPTEKQNRELHVSEETVWYEWKVSCCCFAEMRVTLQKIQLRNVKIGFKPHTNREFVREGCSYQSKSTRRYTTPRLFFYETRDVDNHGKFQRNSTARIDKNRMENSNHTSCNRQSSLFLERATTLSTHRHKSLKMAESLFRHTGWAILDALCRISLRYRWYGLVLDEFRKISLRSTRCTYHYIPESPCWAMRDLNESV